MTQGPIRSNEKKKPIMHMPIPKTDFNLKPWKKTVT